VQAWDTYRRGSLRTNWRRRLHLRYRYPASKGLRKSVQLRLSVFPPNCGCRTQVKAGISAAHLGDHTTAEQHFAVLRALGATDNIDLYLSVANALFVLDRPEDALPYFQVWRCCPQSRMRLALHLRLCFAHSRIHC